MEKEKKSLFKINEGDTALNMLTGGAKAEEKTVEPPKEAVSAMETIEEVKEQPKKKTNRGRKRKYQEGEMVKLTVLLDKDLSSELKTMAKKRGKTDGTDEYKKKYTGLQVKPELREAFSDACTDREVTQSFVMETLYKQAQHDLINS
jgi:hypothetical protein